MEWLQLLATACLIKPVSGKELICAYVAILVWADAESATPLQVGQSSGMSFCRKPGSIHLCLCSHLSFLYRL